MAITIDQQAAIEEVREHAPEYEEYDSFYRGKVEELYASPKVQRLLAKSNLNDLDAINYAKIPVDSVLNRLEITSITATGADGADLSKNVAEIRKDNLLDFYELDAHRKCGSLGDVYLFVWPSKNDAGEVVGVDIRVNSPFTTRLFYDAEDPLIKAFAVKVWSFDEEGKQRCRVNFYYNDKIERYITDPRGSGKGDRADDWIEFAEEDEDSVIENPYDEVPFFHMRTDFPYGIPDHHDAFVPQTMINKLVISHAATIDFQGFPQRYFLLDPTADNTIGSDEVDDEDDDPEFANSPYRSDPGSVWESTARQAGQFPSASPESFIAPFNRYVQAMSQVTGTPVHEFDKSGNIPSGESLKVADAPLVNRANRRKLLCGSTWRDAYEFALELLGFKGAKVAITWKRSSSEPSADDWKLAESKIRAGVPRRTVFIEMGYSPEQVDLWGFTEQQPNGIPNVQPARELPESA